MGMPQVNAQIKTPKKNQSAIKYSEIVQYSEQSSSQETDFIAKQLSEKKSLQLH